MPEPQSRSLSLRRNRELLVRQRDGAALDQWLVLRGGLRLEQFWIDWITEYLDAHQGFEARSARTSPTERD